MVRSASREGSEHGPYRKSRLSCLAGGLGHDDEAQVGSRGCATGTDRGSSGSKPLAYCGLGMTLMGRPKDPPSELHLLNSDFYFVVRFPLSCLNN